MHRFQPTRASPPIRAPSRPSPSTCTDLSQSVNGAVAPELQHLSVSDIDILDAVIKRAGPSATTFFTIFKAYSDVLKERGLDPQEVVYYGKLLKLGTLKGKDWGEKWAVVKAQSALNTLDTHTVGSIQSESDLHHVLSDSDGQYASISRAPPSKPTVPHRPHKPELYPHLSKIGSANHIRKPATTPKKFQLDPKEFPILASIAQRANAQPSSTFQSDDEQENVSPIPPSYKSTIFDATAPIPPRQLALDQEKQNLPTKAVLTSNKRAKMVDLDDAFKNIKLEQDEKFADKFREDMLVARCWEMWRQGFSWITTTHQQIGEARDKLQLRLFMQRWQTHLGDLRHREDELVKQFDTHRLRLIFGVWKTSLKHRRQIAWRNDMRQKMKLVKNKSEARIQKSAWMLWRQLHLAYNADNHYRSTLLIRYHTQWKAKHAQLDGLDNIADQFAANIHSQSLGKFWSRWKNVTTLRRDEHVVVERVNCRIMVNALDLWRERMTHFKNADAFRNQSIMNHAVQTWKRSMNTLQFLHNRVTKHLARQDDLLLRAIIRIWRARMRGKRLEQFQTSLVLRRAWQTWRTRIASHDADIDLVNKFAKRVDARVAANTLVRWQQVLKSHKNAHQYAIKYDDGRLCAKVLLLWRLRLRDNSQSAKVARWANRFFDTRKAWRAWIWAMEEKKRQERLKLWDAMRVRKFVNRWRVRTRETQYYKQCEFIMRDRVEKRIMFNTLTHWTNRVIEVKSRELDTAHRCDLTLLRNAFHKWEICRRQHVEEVSLLENYLLVKQEDVLRRAFHRWLSTKRSAEHRRLTHRRKEAQLRQLAITSAWEKWRERFKEETLRPLEYELLLGSQKNLLRRAFTVWLSKTDSLPAVRFHSKHLKEKFFKNWRNAMPNALRAKKARETDRFNTLAKSFERWMQVYKTKTTLKAVARAKYLQLPAASSRQPVIRSRPLYSSGSTNFPRRALRSAQDGESDAGDVPLPESSKPSFVPRTGLTKPEPRSDRSATRSEYSARSPESPRRPFIPRTELIKPKPRSERSVPRSDYGLSAARQPSPGRSIVSMPGRHVRSPRPVSGVALLPQSKVGGEGGTLWSAIKDMGHTRRPRNL